MTMTSTAHESMLQSADTQLAALDTKQRTIKDSLQDLTSSLETMKQGQEASAQKQTEAQAAIAHYEQKHNQSEAYAKLAKGTPKERSAINAASATRREMVKARETYDLQHESYNEYIRTTSAQKTELQQQAVALSQELDTLQRERKDLLAGREQAQSEMGMTRYQAHVAAYHAKQKTVETLKEQLLTAEMDLHDVYTTALDDLQGWSAYQHGIRDLEEPSDATMQVLKASLLYADTILSERYNVNQRVVLPSLKNAIAHMGLWDATIVHQDDVIASLSNSSYSGQRLQHRRDIIQALINEYRSHIRNQ